MVAVARLPGFVAAPPHFGTCPRGASACYAEGNESIARLGTGPGERRGMELDLVRHGEAKPESEDPERSLTDRGEETVRRMAAWGAQVGLRVDQIRHGGKRRAEQTADLLGARLNPAQGVIAVEGLKPNPLSAHLARISRHKSLG